MAENIHRSGQRQLFRRKVASASVIARGDMLWLNASENQLEPADLIDHDTNEATTQAVFANEFFGIAYESSISGETDPISADISAESVYECDCVSATYDFDEFLGPNLSGSNLENQNLAAAVATSSVAGPAEAADSAVTRLKVKFASVYNVSANHNAAEIG